MATPYIPKWHQDLYGQFMCAALSLALVCSSTASAAPKTDQMGARVASSLQTLQHFKVTGSLVDLRNSIYLMEGAPDIAELTPGNFIAQRRTLVRGWAQILKSIEQAYDPTFNQAQQLACPTPPREASGIQRPPCVDPKTVQDPNARAQYNVALNAYYVQVKRANRYQQLLNVDELAMSALDMNLDILRKVAPDGVTPDFTSLDGILEEAGLSNSRRMKVDTMIYGRPIP